jgi:protein MpaA
MWVPSDGEFIDRWWLRTCGCLPLAGYHAAVHRRPAPILVLSCCLTLMTGCASIPLAPEVPGSPPLTEPHGSLSAYVETTIEGRRLDAQVFGKGRRTVLFLGAIHGSEGMSHELLRAFAAELEVNPMLCGGHRVVVATPINPDGLQRAQRHNARNIDLNRNFPASNFSRAPNRGERPLSEPESRFVMHLLDRYQPQVVVSVHAPLHCVNFDGPARPLAVAMARRNGYPLRPSLGYATPGSLGSYVGADLKIPIITLELPRGQHPLGFYAENRDALLEAIQWLDRTAE